MSAELKVERLRKVFGTGIAAVDDVSFRIEAGEIVVLLGPSGCGKTTTLRCVAGLEHPTSGTISIGGDSRLGARAGHPDAAAPAQHRHGVPVVRRVAAHDGAPERRLSAAHAARRRAPSATARWAKRSSWSGLSDYADRPVVSLSGGQMQRVALARSLVYQPQLLLLDEPLSNLDAKLRLRLRDDLRRIIKKTGVTALYVTHDQAEAVVLGDRIGVMRDGKLLQMASADELYNRPADLFVANFTGASNLLEGRALLERNGEFGTVEAGSGEQLSAWLPASVAAGEAVKIAVRPENVRLGGNGAAEPNTFTAQRGRHALSGHADRLRARHAGRPHRCARARHAGALSRRQRRRGGAAAGPVLGLSREPERRGVTSSTRHPGRDACIAIRDHVQLCLTTDPG